MNPDGTGRKKISDIKDGITGFKYSPDQTKILFTKELEALPLANVLDKYLPGSTEIDFLSVDVESLDLEVLKSNDWNKYRPKIVLVEIFNSSLHLNDDPIFQYLTSKNYLLFAKAFTTSFFMSKEFFELRAK